MLFEIHPEGKISFKRLTDADLNRSPKSHQTHIGLSNNSLTFMPDNKKEYNAMLIYKSYCDILSCDIAKILRADGKRDAPKISTTFNEENVVKKIRTFAKETVSKSFFLLWFGLDSSTPVFWLIEEDSYDFKALDIVCDFTNLPTRKIVILDSSDDGFRSVLDYAKLRMESVTVNLQKDLELSVEVETENPKFKDSDVKKARSYIQTIGRQGEEMVNAYLERQKQKKEVENFEWMNKSSEQGKPFDFFIRYASGKEQWIDVKTTEHEFGQAIIVSKNEIRFITEKERLQYAVFRVYSKKELEAKLKICYDCLKYVKKLSRDIDYMTQSMSDYKAAIVNYKIAFEPGDISFKSISSEIAI